MRSYKKLIEEKGIEVFPPVQVVEYKNTILLVDGHHRLAAAKSLGIKEIPTRILTDTEFNRIAGNMGRFKSKQALYSIAARIKDTPDSLPADLLPKY
ncbi:MAG: ParB N-terminal domain-containing protein [Bacteroidia bacterium]|nr:ParB N-terminal domain-containing protein [Bacteroidia bacterium]